jgi:hypothetical protein
VLRGPAIISDIVSKVPHVSTGAFFCGLSQLSARLHLKAKDSGGFANLTKTRLSDWFIIASQFRCFSNWSLKQVRRDTFNASKGDPDLIPSLRAMIIAEDAEAEADTPILEEADMAPALKEDTFVARIMKQNSMEQRRWVVTDLRVSIVARCFSPIARASKLSLHLALVLHRHPSVLLPLLTSRTGLAARSSIQRLSLHRMVKIQ